jgi:hypothetical protein
MVGPAFSARRNAWSRLFGGVPLRIAILVLLALAAPASADSFEFLAYTPPGTPWVKQVQPTGAIAYMNVGTNNRGGMIMLVPSVTPIGSPTEEFQTYWRVNVDTIMKAQMPTPQVKPARDMTMVWGSAPIDVGGQRGDIQVVMFVGRNSVLGTITVTVGSDAVRDVAAFNASVKILDESRPNAKSPAVAPAQPERPALAPQPPAPTAVQPAPSNNGLGFDYEVPPGYAKKSDAGMTWLVPRAPKREGACMYGLLAPTASTGDLEKDVDAAMKQVPAGFHPVKHISTKQRGIGATGWPYWYKFGGLDAIAPGPNARAMQMMALAFPAPNNQVNIVVGIGTSDCITHESAFERIFHSIKPKGWVSDGGKAYKAALHAGWRYIIHSPQTVMIEYAFYPSGRYNTGHGMIAEFQGEVWKYELNYAGVGEGSWKNDGTRITLMPDSPKKKKENISVRMAVEWIAGHWRETIIVLKEDDKGEPWNSAYHKILTKGPE